MRGRAKNTRRLNTTKLMKRLLLLAMLFIFLVSAFFLVRGAWRFVFKDRKGQRPLTLAVAERAEISGIKGKALLLRDEIVVLSEAPGQVSLLVADGEKVESGQAVLEITDEALLVQLDAEREKLSAGSGTAEENQRLEKVTESLAEAQGVLSTALLDYQKAVADQAVADYDTLYDGAAKAAKDYAVLQEEYLTLYKNKEDIAFQLEQLEERRRQASVVITAPAAGEVLYWVDGWEEKAIVGGLNPDLYGTLTATDKKPAYYETEAGAAVVAGQPVFKVSVDKEPHLLVALDDAGTIIPSEWETVSVLTADEATDGLFRAEIITDAELAPGQLLLRMEAADVLSLARSFTVSLEKEGEIFCRIPKDAIISIENRSFVFALEANVVHQQPIRIMELVGKKDAIVAGVMPGTSLVVKPEGLADGQDVTERLGK